MPGDYKDSELLTMSPEEVAAAVVRGWSRPAPEVAERPAYAGVEVRAKQVAPEPRGDVWQRRKAGSDDIFTCPSGQTCRLRPVSPDRLMLEGILDNVNHLEVLAQKLVGEAQGLPPEKATTPTREDFAELLTVINKVVPMAIVEPKVYPDPEDGEAFEDGILYISDIDLDDRMAIMAEALKGIRALDRFRHA